jgi:type III restriction enzyme
MRPALGQVPIIYGTSQKYQPDFVVETKDTIYIIEVKAYNRQDDIEVKLKGEAATAYCKHINSIEGAAKKKWEYVMVLDREISRGGDFGMIVRMCQPPE